MFLASFLLFEVELIAARLLLPRFGSSASVWTTSLVFFQLALLAGYLYAARVGPRAVEGRYRWVHVGFVLLPVLVFPFRVVVADLPPAAAVLVALAVSVGAPFVALSTTSIVAQAWLTRTRHPARGDPYFLYGTSNAGALLALIAYPLIIEPALDLGAQQRVWYGLYGVYVLLHGLCLMGVLKAGAVEVASAEQPVAAAQRARPVLWYLLSAAANALLMAATNVVTADAPLPLLWVIPLTIYLLTLVICFAPRMPSRRTFDLLNLLGLVGAAGALVFVMRQEHLQVAYIVMHGMALWVGCLILHRNLAQSKPADPRQLGAYYLALSGGGVLGAMLIGLVMPVVFRRVSISYVDYAAAGLVILAALLTRDAGSIRRWAAQFPVRAGALVTVASLITAGLCWAGVKYERSKVYGSRTFYGLYSVTDEGGLRWFHHGNTVHGVENLDPAKSTEPLAYFHHGSPVGTVLASPVPRERVGLVGLGVGSLTAYGRPGDRWEVFELDPEVEVIARQYFQFLASSQAEVAVRIGDARLTLEQVPDGQYDVLILDAFSSDYIPVHLLTREAFELYLRKLKPGGLILCNISNRIFDLRRVLTRVAAELSLHAAWDGGVEETEERRKAGKFESLWFSLTADPAKERLLLSLGWKGVEAAPALKAQRPWTDGYVNLFQAFRR